MKYEIASKEELKDLLIKNRYNYKYKIFKYFNALLELNFSVLKHRIDKKTILIDDNFFAKVAKYNIYNRTIKLAKEINPDLEIIGNKKEGQLYIMLDGYKVFSYVIHSLDNEKDLGNMYLFQIIENENLRKTELEKAKYQLQNWQNQQNPYLKTPESKTKAYTWELRRYRNITTLHNLIENIYNYDNLHNNKDIMDTINRLNQKLFEDYGLSEAKFTPQKEFAKIPYYQHSNLDQETKTRILDLEISNKIRYI